MARPNHQYRRPRHGSSTPQRLRHPNQTKEPCMARGHQGSLNKTAVAVRSNPERWSVKISTRQLRAKQRLLNKQRKQAKLPSHRSWRCETLEEQGQARIHKQQVNNPCVMQVRCQGDSLTVCMVLHTKTTAITIVSWPRSPKFPDALWYGPGPT